MSIEQMNIMSYVMFGISGVSAAAAAVLFFVLDIAKCWQMVSGKHLPAGKKQREADRAVAAEKAVTERLRRYPTEEMNESTVLLSCTGGEETQMLDTADLEMIQDIVYMQDTVEIGEILPKYNFSEKRIN